MSPVIKSTDAGASGRVRPLPVSTPGRTLDGSVLDPEIVRLQADLDQAVALIQGRDAELERLQNEFERAVLEAEAKGRKAGLDEAANVDAERLDRLKQAIAAASGELSRELASLERLAPALALECLEKLIGDPQQRGALLRDTILHNVRLLDADAIMRVDVPMLDFPETAELSELLSAVAHRRIEVRHAADLKPGGCRIRLQLGELEVGLGQQWDRLGAILKTLASSEAAA